MAEKAQFFHGMYSQQAVDAGCPTFWHLSVDGDEIEVSAVTDNPHDFLWPDAIDKGRINTLSSFLRPGKLDRFSHRS
jgi:hypothetical protein